MKNRNNIIEEHSADRQDTVGDWRDGWGSTDWGLGSVGEPEIEDSPQVSPEEFVAIESKEEPRLKKIVSAIGAIATRSLLKAEHLIDSSVERFRKRIKKLGHLVVSKMVSVDKLENVETFEVKGDTLGTVDNDEKNLMIEQNVGSMERYRYARVAPRLEDQISDDGRENGIIFINGANGALFSATSTYGEDRRETTSEHDALVGLRELLVLAESGGGMIPEEVRKDAEDILKNLTFIGDKEYKEAVECIAGLWKKQLHDNPDLYIFPVAGQIAKTGGYIDANDSLKPQVKSDDWLLENILANFTDEELAQFGDRLIMSEAEMPNDIKPENLKIVLLDDWTISGSQLSMVYNSMSRRIPRYRDCISIQLVAASKDRIENGLKCYDDDGSTVHIPLTSYYMAHEASCADHSGTRITGSHSSVDYDFEEDMAKIVDALRTSVPGCEQTTMPASTNIVRPYRLGGVTLSQRRRLEDQKRRLVVAI